MNKITTTPRLPEYEEPPVVEVGISLQFKALEALRAPLFGLLWNVFRIEGYSHIEEHGELEEAFEDFEGSSVPKVGVRVQTFDDAPPPPRVWFLNEAQNELIQVQRDRLIVNWRRGANSEPYPRYPHIIERFRSALATFVEFAKSEKVGAVVPTQCEVTYVNHMPSGLGWSKHGELSRVVTTWENRYSDGFLATPEDIGFRARYRMDDDTGRPLGRLHVLLQPAFNAVGGQPIFVLNLTARGKPEPADSAGLFRMFDHEHQWIVRGFTSITTKHMHELWRRRDG
jgi:uncharacterized protein (TIGR04255 family)